MLKHKGQHYQTRPRLKKVIKWVALSTLLLILSLGAAAFVFVYHTFGQISSNDTEVIEGAKEQLDIPDPGHPENILILGVNDETELGDSDTMMLVRVDSQDGFISVLSIPRDIKVEIPGYGQNKINSAYTFGRSPLAIKTVKELTGEPVNHFVTINLGGFEKAVDALGGVYIDVDQRYFNDNSEAAYGETYEPIDIQPGYQKLNGHDALEFARYRHTDSDFVRIARQQTFINDAKSQLVRLANLVKIPQLTDIFAANTTSDIGPGEAMSLIKFGLGVKKDHIYQGQFPIKEQPGSTYLLIDNQAAPEALRSFESPRITAPEPPVPGAPPLEFPSQQTKQTPVEILNGGASQGAAVQVAALLKDKGLRNVTVDGNAKNIYGDNQIYFKEGGQPAADELAAMFKPSQEAPMPQELSTSAQILIVLGKSFGGSLSEKQPAPQPSLEFEEVPEAAPAWRHAAQQSSFSLERPASFPKDFKCRSFRSYQIETGDDPKPALKVVCENQFGNPWGIMETTFTDAPLMNEPSVQRDINGKSYRFYYYSDKLRYLAWQDGEVLYWISNSLQNNLDEETMIKLALSFRPVDGA